MEIHVVQPGETLYSIAGQYGTDPLLLREANGGGPGGALAVGQALVVQIVRTFHVVQPGETLSAVARRDSHGQNGRYEIRSLYFDDPKDTALREKIDGVSRREKFRLLFCGMPPVKSHPLKI